MYGEPKTTAIPLPKTIVGPKSFHSSNGNDKKSAVNVKAQMSLIESMDLLPLAKENRGLVNPFSKKKAMPEQENDLLKFYTIGQSEINKYLAYYILKQASVQALQRKRKLCTFSERNPSLVLKCLHKKLKWSKQMGKPIDIVAEQYIQLPLAIADADGSPLKGQKSYTTKV